MAGVPSFFPIGSRNPEQQAWKHAYDVVDPAQTDERKKKLLRSLIGDRDRLLGRIKNLIGEQTQQLQRSEKLRLRPENQDTKSQRYFDADINYLKAYFELTLGEANNELLAIEEQIQLIDPKEKITATKTSDERIRALKEKIPQLAQAKRDAANFDEQADLSAATSYLSTANVGPQTRANPGNASGTGLLGGRRKTRKSRKRKTKKQHRR